MFFTSNKALKFRTLIIVNNEIHLLRYDMLVLQCFVAAPCLNLTMTVYYILNLFYHLAMSLNSNTQRLAVDCLHIIIQPIKRNTR